MDKQTRGSVALPNAFQAVWKTARQPWAAKILRQGGMAGMGYLLAGVELLEGAHPLGLAWGAAFCGQGQGAGALVGALLGYGALGSQGLPYCAALLVCAACALVFTRLKMEGGRLFMSFCAFLSLLCTGSAALMVHFSSRGMALLLCEVVLCGCMVYCYCLAGEQAAPGTEKDKLRLVGVGAVLLSLLLAAEPVRLFHILSPARAVAVLTVMAVAYCGGGAGGAAAGVAFGAALDLAAGVEPHFAGVYGCAGLLAGLSHARSRLAFACGFVLAHCAATLWGLEDPRAVAGLYECFCASVFFLVLPPQVFRWLRAVASPPASVEVSPRLAQAAGARLRQATRALEALSMTLADAAEKVGRHNDEDISQVFKRAAERVCSRCPVCTSCWDKDYVSTFGAMNDVTARLRQQGKLEPEDFPTYFGARCVHLRPFTGAVNDAYAALLRRRRQQSKSGGAKQLLRQQFEGVQGVLRDVESGLRETPEYFPSLQNRAQNVAAAYFHRPRVTLYAEQSRMYCEIRVAGEEDLPEDDEAFTRSLSLALGRHFMRPEPVLSARGKTVRCRERERFAVQVSCAVRKKEGESVSGDQNMNFRTEDGRAVIMLADGMGSGDGAAAVSLDTLALIARFAKAGCSLCESARAVAPVLAARLEERGFATLDLLEIDLFSGRCALTKYGAAPSWLLSGGQAKRFVCQGLPAGLTAGEPSPEPIHFTLEDTCTLVMLSDGVADALDGDWFLQCAKRCAAPADMAAAAIDAAVRRAERPLDDMTALVVSIVKIPD